jgi:hypothetical protein
MTDAMQVKEALADEIETYGVMSFLREDRKAELVAALRAPSPAALDPVTVEAYLEAFQRIQGLADTEHVYSICSGMIDKLSVLIGQPSGDASDRVSSTNNPGTALAEPTTGAAGTCSQPERPNRGLDSPDRGQVSSKPRTSE